MSETRQQYIDFIAGLMILWMLVYHLIQHVWCVEGIATNPCIYFPWLSFFMPWFFYKSGLFKARKDRSETYKDASWLSGLKKDARKLLWMFVIGSLVGYVCYLVIHLLDGTATLRSMTYSVARKGFLEGKIPLNEPMWFLLTLFAVRQIASIALRKLHPIVLIVVGYVIAGAAYVWNFSLLPLWVANGGAGLAFFSLGYWLGEKEQEKWLWVPCVVVYVVCCIWGFPMVDMVFNKLLNGCYWLWIPTAFAGCVTVNMLGRGLMSIKDKLNGFRLPNMFATAMEWVGKNAMLIYVWHYIPLQIFISFAMYNDWIRSNVLLLCVGWYVFFIAMVKLWSKDKSLLRSLMER